MSTTNFKTENNTYRKLIGNGLTYRIPRFQRDYSWGQEEWEDDGAVVTPVLLLVGNSRIWVCSISFVAGVAPHFSQPRLLVILMGRLLLLSWQPSPPSSRAMVLAL